MGSRASYVIIKGGAKKYFYHHWGAQQIPRDLFWGSDISIPFIESLPTETELLDDTWCEGAVVVNCDKQELLLFGGEDILWSNTLKRVYLALLAYNWRNWNIRWAKNEIYTIAVSIGDNTEKIIKPDPQLDFKLTKADYTQSMQWDGAVTTIKRNGNLKHYEMDFRADHILSQGEEVLSTIESFKPASLTKQTPEKEYDSFLFIDTDAAKILYCNEYSRHYMIHDRLATIWGNWHLTEHNQGMYQHAKLCVLDWRDFVCDQDLALKNVKDSLLWQPQTDPGDAVKALTDEGYDVKVASPFYFQKDKPAIDFHGKTKIVLKAINRWLKEGDAYEKALGSEIW